MEAKIKMSGYWKTRIWLRTAASSPRLKTGGDNRAGPTVEIAVLALQNTTLFPETVVPSQSEGRALSRLSKPPWQQKKSCWVASPCAPR